MHVHLTGFARANRRCHPYADVQTPSTPSGILELLPNEQVIHDAMLDSIRRAFATHGFQPVETPVFEKTEVLLTKTGGDTERQVYFAQSAGSLEQGDEPDLALRFDLTVPLARYVAEHEHDLVFPFRRYQIQRVYRGERPQRGRFREFYQCDIDIVDRDELSLRHDAEVPVTMIAVLDSLQIGSFTIAMNSRRLMAEILAGLAVPSSETDAVMREIDKLPKKGAEKVTSALVDGGMSPDNAAGLLEVTATRATGLAAIEDALARHDGAGAVELAEVFSTMVALGAAEDRFALDLSIARGLDYYTGTVYETTLDDHPELGSICSGGRYDDLAGLYTKTRLPGVGMSIGFTRLFWQLREAGLLPESAAGTDVVVTLMDDADLAHGLAIASLLRGAGIATETNMTPDRLGRQLKRAGRQRMKIAIIAGEEERARGVASVKRLDTGDQTDHELNSLASSVANLLTYIRRQDIR